MISHVNRARRPRDRKKLDLITVGEFYNDLIFHRLDRPPRLGEELKTLHFARSPGGGAAITAVAARRLGLRVGLLTVVGDAAELEPLQKERIDTGHSLTDSRKRTAITVAVSTRRDRYFLTYQGANTEFQRLLPWRRLYPYLRLARHVHLAFAPLNLASVTRLLRRLRADGVSTSIDVGWNPALAARPGFWEWVGSATIFFPDRMEALALTGRRRLADALAALADLVPIPVVKMGAQGAASWQHGRAIRVPVPKTKAVDSTGAGDAFDGGFLHGFLHQRPLAECLRWGNLCGTLAVSAAGGIAGLRLSPKMRLP